MVKGKRYRKSSQSTRKMQETIPSQTPRSSPCFSFLLTSNCPAPYTAKCLLRPAPHNALPPLSPDGPRIGLKPILFAYSTSSALVNRSPPFQLAELVLALNLFVRVLKSSSMLSGLIGPKSSSGFRVDCAWSAWRSSGDSAH
jgi:hypothetical protein